VRRGSGIGKRSSEETLKCSAELKLSGEAHGAECLTHQLCGMDGDEGIATLTVPKSARQFRSIRRIVSGREDKHDSPLITYDPKISGDWKAAETVNCHSVGGKKKTPWQTRCNFLQFPACGALSYDRNQALPAARKRIAQMRSASWDLMTNSRLPLRRLRS
jgi:hypothetical protein